MSGSAAIPLEWTPEARKQGVAGVFSRAAESYDDVVPFFAHFGERIVAACGIGEGQQVLDVGCGLGACLLPAARLVGDRGHVTGVDLAQGMVDRLRRRIESDGLHNADVRVMDAEALEFSDGSFDALTCAFVVMFFPRADAALAEFHRVLRPGARAAVSVWAGSEPNLGFLGEVSARCGGINLEAGPPPAWSDDAGFAAMLERAGFSGVRVLAEEATFEYADAEAWWQSQLGHGARVYWDLMDPDRRPAFREAALQRYAEVAGPGGRCAFVQRARIAVATA